jgi:hypothetical protein
MVLTKENFKNDINNIILKELTDEIYVARSKEFNPNSIGEETREFEIINFLGNPFLTCRRVSVSKSKRREDILAIMENIQEEIYLGSQSALAGLILHLTFNESDDYKGIAYDKSGKGYNATLTNFIDIEKARVSSRFDYGFACDFSQYTDNYAVINDNTDLRLLNNFSICFWIYPLTVASKVIVVKRSGNGYQVQLSGATKNILFFLNTEQYGTTENSISEANKWYHIAVTRDDSKLKIFINGEEDVSFDLPAKIISYTGNMIIGNNSTYTSNLTAYLDDFKIFNIALTQNQIKELIRIEEIDISFYDLRVGDRIYDRPFYPSTSDFNYKVIDSIEKNYGFLKLKIKSETV